MRQRLNATHISCTACAECGKVRHHVQFGNCKHVFAWSRAVVVSGQHCGGCINSAKLLLLRLYEFLRYFSRYISAQVVEKDFFPKCLVVFVVSSFVVVHCCGDDGGVFRVCPSDHCLFAELITIISVPPL